jgi:hypothetical protein
MDEEVGAAGRQQVTARSIRPSALDSCLVVSLRFRSILVVHRSGEREELSRARVLILVSLCLFFFKKEHFGRSR